MTITLPTLRFYAYHGVLPQERKVGVTMSLHFISKLTMMMLTKRSVMMS